MFDWADQTVAAWLAVPLAIGTLFIGYLAIPRRKLDVLYSHVRQVNEPIRAPLEITVTSRGQRIDQPVYLIHVQIRCSGNRDVVMADGEFIEIETGDGIEIIGSTYGTPGKMKWSSIENTHKTAKFKFDLLKRSQKVVFNIYVTSPIDLTQRSLPRLFPATVHIKDVQPVFLSKNRLESLGILIMGIGFFGLVGGFQLLSAFGPVDQERLLINASQKRVLVRLTDDPTELRICEAVDAFWKTSECHDRPISEVANFIPATKSSDAQYVNSRPLWHRILATLIALIILGLFLFGRTIANILTRAGERMLTSRG